MDAYIEVTALARTMIDLFGAEAPALGRRLSEHQEPLNPERALHLSLAADLAAKLLARRGVQRPSTIA